MQDFPKEQKKGGIQAILRRQPWEPAAPCNFCRYTAEFTAIPFKNHSFEASTGRNSNYLKHSQISLSPNAAWHSPGPITKIFQNHPFSCEGHLNFKSEFKENMTHFMNGFFIASSLGMGLLLMWSMPLSNFMVTNWTVLPTSRLWPESKNMCQPQWPCLTHSTTIHWMLAFLNWYSFLSWYSRLRLCTYIGKHVELP